MTTDTLLRWAEAFEVDLLRFLNQCEAGSDLRLITSDASEAVLALIDHVAGFDEQAGEAVN